jgi:hypothetical protein
MPNEYFQETNESNYSAYRAWEARCKELGYEGPHRMVSLVEWQFVGPNGTAGMYNAATGRGFVFVPAPSASDARSAD